MFVWIFHRISGVVLIFVLGFQLFSGFFQASSSNMAWVETMAGLHKHTTLNCVLVFMAIFHAAYGIRTIVLDLGAKREKLVFWVCTIVATILCVVFLILFLKFVAA